MDAKKALDEARAALNAVESNIEGTESRIKAALKNLNRRI
jgi:hypothetical protein